ncbi:MAG: TusE/DsrC/DsvC family sulfur relay protein [Anaerolineaceae bacterium]|nr:TusE/DsrC/DsvC family sulfur relay protein [Anaerolineaceae bacterium]
MTDVLAGIMFDAEGFMQDAKAWNADVAKAIAEREGITLNDRHWVVLNYCRKEFDTKGEAPTLRNITKNTDVGTKELYELFPGGPGKLAAKVSGLKKPTGCI